jgi:hypothetical protein
LKKRELSRYKNLSEPQAGKISKETPLECFIKSLNIKQWKILKAMREKEQVTCKGIAIRIKVIFQPKF